MNNNLMLYQLEPLSILAQEKTLRWLGHALQMDVHVINICLGNEFPSIALQNQTRCDMTKNNGYKAPEEKQL